MTGCSPWKNMMVRDGDLNDAIRNAIYDYSNSAKKDKMDSVYFVYTEDVTADILGVNIYGTYNKVLLITEDSISYSYRAFPTDYLIIEKDLYFWYDSTQAVTIETISVLYEYDLIDTMIINVYIPEMTISHKKGMDYYFCKDDLMKYKKVWTKSAMGYYDPPEINCVEDKLNKNGAEQ